jgi:glyoxylase-like metal-dependent hydrolase (beta-lactamase superfamily II)
MQRLIPINGNSQKLDGGAMFGHVPKAVWSQWITPDEKNRIRLACRALLIQEENRNILLEAGVGAFFDPALRDRYGVEESEHVLLHSLNEVGMTENDIDIIIISHLHFDHAGGLLSAWKQDEPLKLLFPNARYIVSKIAWERANHPHVRDRASFIPHLNELLHASQRLEIVDEEKNTMLGDRYSFMYSHGHTPGLLHTIIHTDDGPIIFASDLIPGSHWVHLPVAMGYDRLAELLIDEKKVMLEYAVKHNARLFYTHDPMVVSSRVCQDKTGKFSVIEPILTF